MFKKLPLFLFISTMLAGCQSYQNLEHTELIREINKYRQSFAH